MVRFGIDMGLCLSKRHVWVELSIWIDEVYMAEFDSVVDGVVIADGAALGVFLLVRLRTNGYLTCERCSGRKQSGGTECRRVA